MNRSLRSFDGARIAWSDNPGAGSGPPVLIAHGTGFNSGALRPVTEGLRSHSRRVVAFDHRNHGLSQGALTPSSWWDSARDCLELAREIGGPVVGVGHSMGGATLMLAASMEPELFEGLIVIEPIVATPPFRRDIDHPLVGGAETRRESFGSRQEAHRSLVRPFGSWDPGALEGYVERGVDEAGDLRCAPAWEAETFRAGFCCGALDHLARVSVPVLLLLGGAEDTYPRMWADEIAARCQKGSVEVVEGTNHFLPMTHPHAVVEAYSRFTRR